MKIKNQLIIGSLEFKITDEKLFIETIDGSETYALRSINGISVKDDTAKYNEQLNATKTSKISSIVYLVIGIFLLVSLVSLGLTTFGLVSFGAIVLISLISLANREKEPRLESIVTITMNSGDKTFRFLKSDANSGEVADFVATVESTLTAFHKE